MNVASTQNYLHCSFLLLCSLKEKSLSCVQLFATLWTVAHQVPPSMGFSRQEYWSGLPFPSPGDLSDPGIKPRSPALQPDTLTSVLIRSQIFQADPWVWPHSRFYNVWLCSYYEGFLYFLTFPCFTVTEVGLIFVTWRKIHVHRNVTLNMHLISWL